MAYRSADPRAELSAPPPASQWWRCVGRDPRVVSFVARPSWFAARAEAMVALECEPWEVEVVRA